MTTAKGRVGGFPIGAFARNERINDDAKRMQRAWCVSVARGQFQ